MVFFHQLTNLWFSRLSYNWSPEFFIWWPFYNQYSPHPSPAKKIIVILLQRLCSLFDNLILAAEKFSMLFLLRKSHIYYHRSSLKNGYYFSHAGVTCAWSFYGVQQENTVQLKQHHLGSTSVPWAHNVLLVSTWRHVHLSSIFSKAPMEHRMVFLSLSSLSFWLQVSLLSYSFAVID